jgi:hypothetical protein
MAGYILLKGLAWLVVALVFVVPVSAQTADDLGTFGAFNLVVEEVSADAKAAGITQQDLREMMISALGSANMLHRIKLDKVDRCPCVYLQITIQKAALATSAIRRGLDDPLADLFSYGAVLEILEPVVRDRDGRRTIGTTWHTGHVDYTLSLGALRPRLTESIRDLVTAFSDAIGPESGAPPK